MTDIPFSDLWLHDMQLGGWIVGADEAGRGAWAGPVSGAAVAIDAIAVAQRIYADDRWKILRGANDSKKLTPKRRDEMRQAIIDYSAEHPQEMIWHVELASAPTIDKIGIQRSNDQVLVQSVHGAQSKVPDGAPKKVLVDAMPMFGAVSIIKGDQTSAAIALASTMAKTTRDMLMCELDAQHPAYGFASHKGYHSKVHVAALNEHGALTGIHRFTFTIPGRGSAATKREAIVDDNSFEFEL